jgi:formylglycine-generating enzyme required for sulfatase activity
MTASASFVALERRGQARGYRQWLTPPSEGDAPQPSSLDLQLVVIPAGSFLMGSPTSEEGHQADEGPQHEVKLESFWLGRTPITQAQWREVAGWEPINGQEPWLHKLDPDPVSNLPEANRFLGDQRPVVNVNWFEAMEFCYRLSQRSGKKYTLPSESQWEYACRAGNTTPFHYGETLSAEQANYNATYTYGRGRQGKSRGQTTVVGSFAANAWGLHDMHGNVWEWCTDHWHRSYTLGQQKAPADGSPWLDVSEKGMAGKDGKMADDFFRVLRGGSWLYRPVYCRSASRFNSFPAFAFDYFGFRVCCLPRGPFSSTLEPLGP